MTSAHHTLPEPQMPLTKVKVPGKVILSGEHAVVYGTPALACAIQKYAYANVHSIRQPGMHIRFAAMAMDEHYSLSQLQQLAAKTHARHQDFLQGLCVLAQVVPTPAHFFAAALGASGALNLLNPATGLRIELSMDLVAGGGMGSSAALVAVMLAAVYQHLGQPLSKLELIAKTTHSEHWQHGRSSGLDPYVCVMGGMQEYQLGTGKAHRLGDLTPSYLVTTGRPQSSTGQCVEAVKQQGFAASLWQQFAQVEGQLLQAMSQGDQPAMTKAVVSNHRLLEKIGVVPAAVAEFIQALESLGGAGKICGAGSVTGDQGGLVWALGVSAADMDALCRQHAYPYTLMQADLQGVAYLD